MFGFFRSELPELGSGCLRGFTRRERRTNASEVRSFDSDTLAGDPAIAPKASVKQSGSPFVGGSGNLEERVGFRATAQILTRWAGIDGTNVRDP